MIVGCCSLGFSLAQTLAKENAALAHQLWPWDGRITAQAAAALAANPDASAADRSRSDVLARAALTQDATAALAASTMGVNADARGDRTRARRLFAYAEGLSRRDLATQLWAIEDAVGRGDISSALRHYDVALRVKPELSELLFPVLGKASGDPAIRAALTRTLAAKPEWGDGFLLYLSDKGTDPGATVALLVNLYRAGVAVPDSARARAINTLVAGGRTNEAWAYYAAVHPGRDRLQSRDPTFTANLQEPSLFDWAPINDARVSTSIRSGAFDFAAPPGVGGSLLQQLQLLAPGRYRMTWHGTGIDQAPNAAPYWALTCQGGREIGRAALPNSSQAGGSSSGLFTVPTGCPVQLLTLVAQPSSAAGGLTGQLDRVHLAPVR